jgi:hypothetical protein
MKGLIRLSGSEASGGSRLMGGRGVSAGVNVGRGIVADGKTWGLGDRVTGEKGLFSEAGRR